MQEPWNKSGGWPYEGPRGKSWQLGYRDDEGRVRAKSFKTKSDAGVWSKGYIKADRQGRLREFLLGPGAAAPKGRRHACRGVDARLAGHRCPP